MGHHIFHLHREGEDASGGERAISLFLIATAFLTYTAMMAAKTVYIAEISYICATLGVDKTTASTTNTFYFVAYGLVQVATFFLASKINLVKYAAYTVPISGLLIALMPLSANIYWMWAIFAAAGALQAPVYSTCTHVLTKYLSGKYLTLANSVMNFGFAAGTAVAYLLSALFVESGLWWLPFALTGGGLALFALLLTFAADRAERGRLPLSPAVSEVTSRREAPLFELSTPTRRTVFYTVALVFCFFVSSVYYAVMNWLAVMLTELHGMGEDSSAYMTVLVPVLLFTGPLVAIRLCDRDRDFIRVAAAMLIPAIPISIALACLFGVSPILSFVLSALFLIITNGTRTIVLSVVAYKLRGVLTVAEYTAIANAVASLAAGVAPTLAGMAIDSRGWGVYYALVSLGVVLCLAVALVGEVILSRDSKRKNT